jgi:hypothetical protein
MDNKRPRDNSDYGNRYDKAGMSPDQYGYERENQRLGGFASGYKGQYGSGHNYDAGQNYADRWNDQISQLNYRPGEHTGKGPQGYQRSDMRIQEDVCDILYEHGEIDASGITVTVENGEVTLEGTVDNRQTKRMVEDVIEHVSGVRDVHNRLRVPGQQSHQQDQQKDMTGNVPTEVLAQDASINESLNANLVLQTGITGGGQASPINKSS